MARKRSPTLTDGESRLMNVLWKKERATVGDVVSALPRKHAVAYNTVQTMLRILEAKGYVMRRKDGRAHVYSPLVDRASARKSALRHLVSRFFDDSPELLVLNLLDDERVLPEELSRLKAAIRKAGESTQ